MPILPAHRNAVQSGVPHSLCHGKESGTPHRLPTRAHRGREKRTEKKKEAWFPPTPTARCACQSALRWGSPKPLAPLVSTTRSVSSSLLLLRDRLPLDVLSFQNGSHASFPLLPPPSRSFESIPLIDEGKRRREEIDLSPSSSIVFFPLTSSTGEGFCSVQEGVTIAVVVVEEEKEEAIRGAKMKSGSIGNRWSVENDAVGMEKKGRNQDGAKR